MIFFRKIIHSLSNNKKNSTGLTFTTSFCKCKWKFLSYMHCVYLLHWSNRNISKFAFVFNLNNSEGKLCFYVYRETSIETYRKYLFLQLFKRIAIPITNNFTSVFSNNQLFLKNCLFICLIFLLKLPFYFLLNWFNKFPFSFLCIFNIN